MRPDLLTYRCRSCGSASYRRLTHRSPDGAMQYSEKFRCSGCSLVFEDLATWRRTDAPASGWRGAETAPVLTGDFET